MKEGMKRGELQVFASKAACGRSKLVNPCEVFLNKRWETFGYNTESGCEICGDRPAKIEPRFGYTTCREHSYLNPIRFQEEAGRR